MKTVLNSIDKGLKFLKNEYEKNKCFGFETLFPTILIADCLNQVKKGKELNKKIINKLLLEKSDFFSFNYWFKNTEKHKNEPYPDDLDDTFCALSAIYRFDKKLIDGGDLAKIINLLVLCENTEGGPYRTWILPKENCDKWDDIDVAVNSNVAYFLKLQDIELENINLFIEEKIVKNEITSPFYKGVLPIIYFISRFYSGKQKEKIKSILLSKINKKNSSLELALIISSLVRLNYKKNIKNEWLEMLINKQEDGGCWKCDNLYYYADKQKKTNYIGSKSITTAFVLEALSLLSEKKEEKELSAFKEIIFKTAKNNLDYLPVEIRLPIINFLEKVYRQDKNGTITLTPIFTFKSLKKDCQKKIDEKFLIKLGMISLYGWCAYTIYDGVLDGDSEVKNLILANVFCREMEILFNSLEIDKSTGFFEFYKKIMQEVENANYWELNNLNFDKNSIKNNYNNLEKLADKSLGHALTSIAIICKLGFSTNSDEVKNLFSYFKNFLIARQMNDDIHDWDEDLKKNRLNSASLELFKLIKENEGDNRQVFFWKKVVPCYCKKILSYCINAKKDLKKVNSFDNKRYLLTMINSNMIASKKALSERKKTLDFIKSYC